MAMQPIQWPGTGPVSPQAPQMSPPPVGPPAPTAPLQPIGAAEELGPIEEPSCPEGPIPVAEWTKSCMVQDLRI